MALPGASRPSDVSVVRGADRTGERARVATAVVFGSNGLAFASWIARVPAVRDRLELSTSGVGLLLLCAAVGAMLSLLGTGPLLHRLGTGRAVRSGVALSGLGFLTVALGLATTQVAITGVGLFGFGLGVSLWDVAMNVEGAAVEQRLGRPLMPRLHAGFSLGTVLGALAGAAAAALSVSVAAQLVLTAFAMVALVALAARDFLPDERTQEHVAASSGTGRAWREPRTLAIGLMVLAFAFTEGSANDWVALAMVDGHGTSNSFGAIGFAVFVSAMTAVRVVGGAALTRYGRVRVLRVSAVGAGLGLLLFVFASWLPLIVLGVLLWGAGAALGFPVGMSAGADDPARAAARVSVVSAIGYAAFLSGPPLIGLLGERIALLRALLVVAGALALGLLMSSAARPLPEQSRPAPH